MSEKWTDRLVCFSLLLALIAVGASFAHADVRKPGGAAYQVIGRGLTWASTVNNNWIMDVVSPSTGVCVNVTNNGAGTHTFSITAQITSDLQVTTFTGNTSKWTGAVVSPSTTASILTNTTSQWWIQTAGAAHFVLIITGGSGAGTADIVLSQTAIPCGPQGGSSNGSICNASAVGTIAAAGATITIVPVPPAGQFVHVCAYLVSGDVVTNGLSVTFQNGTAGTCAAPSGTQWQCSPHTGGSNCQGGAGIGQLFQTTVAAQPLCAIGGAIGGLSGQVVSVSYIYF